MVYLLVQVQITCPGQHSSRDGGRRQQLSLQETALLLILRLPDPFQFIQVSATQTNKLQQRNIPLHQITVSRRFTSCIHILTR